MYNAISKTAIAAALLACAASCSNPAAEAARELFVQSETAVAEGRYHDALVLLDTLNARHREQTEIRRNGLRLRAEAMEGIARDSIVVLDAELARATLAVDSLQPLFRHVDNSRGLEGYYLPVGVDEHMMNTTGVQGRVSDDGYFYLVANVQGRKIGLRAVELRDGADTYTSASISSERVITVGSSQTASFSPEDIGGLGEWLSTHTAANKLVLRGSRADADVRLTPALRKELSDCYTYSQALCAKRSAQIRREKFERMLATARDQIANLTVPDANEH